MNKIKQFINPLSGEIVEASIEKKFNTNYDMTPSGENEVNSGVYLVDDRDYISLQDLIQRTKRNNPRMYEDIKNGIYADNVILNNDKEINDYLKDNADFMDDEKANDTENLVGLVNESSESGELTAKSQSELNLARTDPDVVDLSTTNGTTE